MQPLRYLKKTNAIIAMIEEVHAYLLRLKK